MIRNSQRIPRACTICAKKRIRCDKKIPCTNCITKGNTSKCKREVVKVKGKVFNDTDFNFHLYNAKEQQINEMTKEDLIKNITMLNLELKKYTDARSYSIVKKKDIDFYCSAVLYFTRDFDQRPSYLNNFNYESFNELHTHITEEVSNELVYYNMKYIYFIHTAIHPGTFLSQYKTFWSNNEPKHIDLCFDRSLDLYLWTAIWYAILSNSLFFLSKELEVKIGLSEENLFKLAQCSFYASLECLHRAQYLRCPDIKSIQTFCILAGCFHGFGGVHFKNNLLSCMVNLGRSLNLHQMVDSGKLSTINFEIGCRLWWFMVVTDWLEGTNRSSLISFEDFITPEPKNLHDDCLIHEFGYRPQESNLFEAISYNKFVIEVSKVRRTFHSEYEFDVSLTNLDNLLKANNKIDEIEKKWFSYIEKTPPNHILEFQRFLITIDICNQRFITNRAIISHTSREGWMKEFRSSTIEAAITIVEFVVAEIPSYYRKFWIVTEQSVHAAIFLLLDILIYNNYQQATRILSLMEILLRKLRILYSFHVNVKKGVQILNTLVEYVKLNKSFEEDAINLDRLVEALKALPEIYKDRENADDTQRTRINSLLEGSGWLDIVNIFFDN